MWLRPALAEWSLVPGWLESRVTGPQGWGTSPKLHSSGICSKGGAGCSLPHPHPSPLPSRCPEPWEERAAAPWGPQRGPEEQEDKAGPKPHCNPPSLAPGSLPDRTSAAEQHRAEAGGAGRASPGVGGSSSPPLSPGARQPGQLGEGDRREALPTRAVHGTRPAKGAGPPPQGGGQETTVGGSGWQLLPFLCRQGLSWAGTELSQARPSLRDTGLRVTMAEQSQRRGCEAERRGEGGFLEERFEPNCGTAGRANLGSGHL